MTIRAYETYCENIGKVDGSYTVKEFLTDIENGDLVACAVCGEYTWRTHDKIQIWLWKRMFVQIVKGMVIGDTSLEQLGFEVYDVDSKKVVYKQKQGYERIYVQIDFSNDKQSTSGQWR